VYFVETKEYNTKKLNKEFELEFLPAIIFIEVLESCVKMFFSVHSVHLHRCRDELVVIYGSIAISISL